MTLIMEGLCEEDFRRDTGVVDSIPEGAVLRQNGWSVTVGGVVQKYNFFCEGNPMTYPLMAQKQPSFIFHYSDIGQSF